MENNSDKEEKPLLNTLTSRVPTPLGSSLSKQRLYRRSNWKWAVYAGASVLTMGAYFCYDNPASLETTLEYDFGIS